MRNQLLKQYLVVYSIFSQSNDELVVILVVSSPRISIYVMWDLYTIVLFLFIMAHD
jgi:hypothetical protein